MKKVYNLRVEERDDYFRSHDTLSCEILEIDETDKQVIENITLVNGIETKRYAHTKIMINGEYRNISSSFEEEYFESLDDLEKHLKSEYILARSSEYDFLMLVVDNLCNSVVAIMNYKDSSYGCSNDYVNLQELMGLTFKRDSDEN